MTSPSPIRCGGIVLCGGRSSRMGRPKLSLPFGPETMLQRVVRIVRTVVDPVVVVAAPDQQIPPLPPEVLILRDDLEGLGPLAGLAVGLEALAQKADAAFATSCDVPLLQHSFIQSIIHSLADFDLVIPRDGHFHHPLAATYRTHLAPLVRNLINQNRLRPVYLLEVARALELPVDQLRAFDPDLRSLLNANTPDTYQQLLQLAGFAA